MADDVTILDYADAQKVVDTKEVASAHRQIVVLGDPTTAGGLAPIDATTGLKINSAQLPAALAAGGGLKIEGVAGGVAVPVSAAALPLPSGASTSAAQTTAQTALDAIKASVELLDNAVSGAAIVVADGGGSVTVDGSVSVSGVVPGVSATSLGKAEDAVAADGDTGVMMLAVRKDVAATTVGLDGDYHPLEVDANGRLHVIEPSAAAAAASLAVIDDWDESDRAKVNLIVGQAGIAAGAGAVAATVPRVTLASDDPAVALLGTIDADTGTISTNSGTIATNTGNAATSLAIMDDWDNAASDGCSVSGDVAHDAADAGEPVKVGARAINAVQTPVSATNDRTDLLADLMGRLLVALTPRELIVHQTTTITGTSETTVLTAGAAGVFHDLTSIVVINTSATAVRIDFKDATSGTIRFSMYCPAGAQVGLSCDAEPIVQAAAAGNWTATVSSAVTDIRIFIKARKTK